MQLTFEKRANYALEYSLQFSPVFSVTKTLDRLERRSERRYSNMFPARIWGVDVNQEPFGDDCMVENLSHSGLYLRTFRKVELLSEVSLAVRLQSGPNEGRSAAIKGRVIRDNPTENREQGVAVVITQYELW